MTGPQHYLEAERLIAMCVDAEGNPPTPSAPELDQYLRLAQVHATLAQAAATALDSNSMPLVDLDPWVHAASALGFRALHAASSAAALGSTSSSAGQS